MPRGGRGGRGGSSRSALRIDSNYILHLFKEAVVVGVFTTLIGTAVGLYFKSISLNQFIKSKFTYFQNDSNNFLIMALGLFLTGFSAHVLFESLGGNKWYCTNGVACLPG